MMTPPILPLPDPQVSRRAPLSRFTTFRIGGPADWLVVTESIEDVIAALQWAAQRGLPTPLLGGGSNVLAADAGARGLTIVHRTSAAQQHRQLSRVVSRVIADQEVVCDVPAATPLARLARWTVDQGLSGIEWAIGIPGTLGGAVVGNAGAHGGCVADCLQTVKLLDPDYTISLRKREDLGLHYRGSHIKTMLAQSGDAGIILEVTLKLRVANRADLQRQAAAFLARRRQTQPRGWSAGSVFANPQGQSAGRLLEMAGLKGQAQGGAQVSDKHANFIINRGGATASDVSTLMHVCRQRVLDKFGVELTPEIVCFGDWSDEQAPWAQSATTQSGGQSS